MTPILRIQLLGGFLLSLASNNLMRDRHTVSEDTLRYVRIALAAYSREGNLGFYHLWHNDLDEAKRSCKKH